jgi:hypothetical protein
MTAALIVTLAGTACDLVAARSGPVRTWIVHAAIAGAMIAMVIPTAVGAQVMAAALLLTFVWTAVASIRSSRRDGPHRLHDARRLVELAGSAVLLVVMSAHHGSPASLSANAGHEHMTALPVFAASLTAVILIGWGATVALTTAAAVRHRASKRYNPRTMALGGALMLLGMVAMASTALAGR